MIEALLGGKARPAPKADPLFKRAPKRGVTAHVMTRFEPLGAGEKRRLARKLVTRDLAPGRALTAGERQALRRQARPRSAEDVTKRTGIHQRIADL